MEGKILVTGGAGFIGSHVVDALIERGEDVVLVDNFNSYYDPKRKFLNIAPHISHPHFHLAAGNVEDYSFMQALFEKHNIQKVIHLAARAGVRPSIQDPVGYKIANIDGTLNLLELSKKYCVQNFVFASSSSVYGNSTKTPFSETDPADSPISPYAATKRMGELLCRTYNNLFHIPISCLRFFTVYGPRGRPDMAPYIFTDAVSQGKEITLFGNGTSKRDYTYVSDIVSGVIAALDTPLNFEIYNLGNNRMVSLKEFVSLVEDTVGKKALVISKDSFPGDVEITCADISKAEKLLGYHPRVPIEKGMKEFYSWYSKNPF
ncbi:NAD-dependent epimerase/dehydratase family protein [Candidatus Woesearchaeota archaeon]|nr:NAD-dependent epimerase/dehydratase family protein [Candidatus Woesearchaeota archaeon]